MNNKELYKKANNQISADEKLKRKVKNQIFENKKHNNPMIIKFVNVLAVFVLIFSIVWLYMNKSNKQDQIETIINPHMASQEKSLPKIGSKENFIEMLIDSEEKQDNLLQTENLESSNILKDFYMQTNEQVPGVSEADIVKTDGNYIYYIAEKNLNIIKTDTLQVIKKINYMEMFFMPTQMYLYDKYLIVIGEKIDGSVQNSTAYYDIAYMGDTNIIVYDVAEIENIKEVRNIEIEGYMLTSRMVDDTVYLIINNPITINEQTKSNEDMLKPTYYDSNISEEKLFIDFSEISYFPGEVEENNYLILASFSLEEENKLNVEAYLGAGSIVYASKENIYITKPQFENNIIKTTKIYRFALKNKKAIYEADGKVPGSLLNQFSIDEKDGYLRIALTKTEIAQSEQKIKNAVYILNKQLNTVGKTENITEGENIYSVRFIGDKGYIVTFDQTDPLHVIDLSSPYAPTVLGVLEIPGYSTYLHPYDENHIIGLGQEVLNDGEQFTLGGIKVSLFDISDKMQPKEISTASIGQRGTHSESLYNYKALLFSKDNNLLAFPITVMETINNETKITLQGAILYDISLENGIIERARINIENLEENEIIRRFLIIKDSLYVCTTKGIVKLELSTMQEVNKIKF